MFLSTNCYVPNCECVDMIHVDDIDILNENDNLILQKWNGYIMREYRKAMIEHKENIVCREICKKNINTRKNIIH